MWRVRGATAAAESIQAPADPKVAEKLADGVTAAIRAVESGTVLEPGRRKIALEVAEQRMRLARSAARDADDPGLQKRLANAQRRLAKLRGRAAAGPDPLLSRLADWTADLPQPETKSEASTFNHHAALRSAARQAADPNAVFAPALAALASGLGQSPKPLQPPKHLDSAAEPDDEILESDDTQRPKRLQPPKHLDLTDELDHDIRSAALRGRVFDVLALGCLAAVTGQGSLADALVAAITTPAFFSTVDRSGIRIAYTALANLARPATNESYRAAAACAYLMRRERPGRDEMELLAPAAIQSETIDPAEAFLLFAQWLKWEREHDPRAPLENGLPQFGHVARNLGYALDSSGFEPFKRALPSLVDHELGGLLVRHLVDQDNRALEVSSVPPKRRPGDDDDVIPEGRAQYGAWARAPVARFTNPDAMRDYTPLLVRPYTRMAEAIDLLRLQQPLEVPQPQARKVSQQPHEERQTFSSRRHQAAQSHD